MRLALLMAILISILLPARLQAEPAGDESRPVLIELFTSEGCSSCPPADSWLQQLDRRQPVSGARLIVLSEHVDYWDYQGWRDPYSSSQLTARQAGYVRALSLGAAATPQFIIDGATGFNGAAQQMLEVLRRAAAAAKLRVQIVSARVDPNNRALLRAHVVIDATGSTRDADVYAAIALEHAESHVAGGENSGRQLTHVAVVESLSRLGTVVRGGAFDRDVEIKLKPAQLAGGFRLVVFVQQPGPGPVVGAAQQALVMSGG
jgi:hypothetical protein